MRFCSLKFQNLVRKIDLVNRRWGVLFARVRCASSFQGGEGAKPELQARVWNLLNKGQIFEKMVQHPTVMNIIRNILGDDMQLGSIASNTIFPGGSGQEPHIDYPYWDYYSKSHWPYPPKHKDIPFNMNTQVLIPLDDMTSENGATSIRPRSHLEIEYPTDVEEYRSMLSIDHQKD